MAKEKRIRDYTMLSPNGNICMVPLLSRPKEHCGRRDRKSAPTIGSGSYKKTTPGYNGAAACINS